MTTEQRFEAGFAEEATNDPGLVLGQDGVVSVVEPGGARRSLSDGLLVATRTFDNDEIKALPSNLYEIIPAPGAGKGISAPVLAQAGGFVAVKKGDADYGNIDVSAVFHVGVGTGKIVWYGLGAEFIPSLFGTWGAGGWVGFATPTDLTNGGAFSNPFPADHENQPLRFGIENPLNGPSIGDFTGGDPDNTLTVSVTYAIIDL